MLGFIANVVNNPDGYGKAYPYDLTTSTNFMDYNIEQQASICADYWAVLQPTDTRFCSNPPSPTVSDYAGLMAQVQNPNASQAAAPQAGS